MASDHGSGVPNTAHCPKCDCDVWPMTDGTCPGCQRQLTEAPPAIFAARMYDHLGVEPIPTQAVPNAEAAYRELGQWMTELPKAPTAYTPSGRAPLSAHIRMVASLPIAAVAALLVFSLTKIVVAFLILGILWLPNHILRTLNITQSGGTWETILGTIAMIFATAASASLAGGSSARIVSYAGRLGKNRSHKVASIYSVTAILLMVTSLVVIFVGGVIASKVQFVLGSQWWLVVVNLMLVAGVGSLASFLAGGSDTFCEDCGVFMKQHHLPTLSYRACRHAIEALKTGDKAEFVRRLISEPGQRGKPAVTSCPRCGAAYLGLTMEFYAHWPPKQPQGSHSVSWLAASVKLDSEEAALLPNTTP